MKSLADDLSILLLWLVVQDGAVLEDLHMGRGVAV